MRIAIVMNCSFTLRLPSLSVYAHTSPFTFACYTMSSSSTVAQQNNNVKCIPVKTVILDHPSQIPLDYGTTPGGTMFSTTPGGTRIVYERKFLLHCRNSPHSKSPPCNLPSIPGVTEPEDEPKLSTRVIHEESGIKENIAPKLRGSAERDDMFEMDM